MNLELTKFGEQINAAEDASDGDALRSLDGRCEELGTVFDGPETPILWYFRSNIHAALQNIGDPHSWNWRQPHRERQVLYLRRARSHPSFEFASCVMRAQITTNLANSLNSLGRSIEAIALYDEALRYHKNFAMALGNRGLARMGLARLLHDSGHRGLIFLAAHEDFCAAVSEQAVWEVAYPGVREQFIGLAGEIASRMDIAKVRELQNLDGHSLGSTAKEKRFRHWALERQLFLNPLNLLGPHSIAATDRFGLPSYRAPMSEPPQYLTWFSQLKQEFAAARLLLYEAEYDSPYHFADRELSLVDTLDYPVYGLIHEKARMSFRAAYSLLDKVAGFVNSYFQLGDKPNRVSARSVWLTKDGASIRPEFAGRTNLPLRGLYWLALDIAGTAPNDPDPIAPDAPELHRLRNALEHRCLVLRDFLAARPEGILEATTVEAFRAHCLTMLRLARAALLYLSLSVGREEQVRRGVDPGRSLPMELPTYRGRR